MMDFRISQKRRNKDVAATFCRCPSCPRSSDICPLRHCILKIYSNCADSSSKTGFPPPWERPSAGPSALQPGCQPVKVASSGVWPCWCSAPAAAPPALLCWGDVPPSSLRPSASPEAPGPPARPFAQPCGRSSRSAWPCACAPSAGGFSALRCPGAPADCGLVPPPRTGPPGPRSTWAGGGQDRTGQPVVIVTARRLEPPVSKTLQLVGELLIAFSQQPLWEKVFWY